MTHPRKVNKQTGSTKVTKAERRLESRVKDYNTINDKTGYTKPGSLKK